MGVCSLRRQASALLILALLVQACGGDGFSPPDIPPGDSPSIYSFVNGCYGVEARDPDGELMVLSAVPDAFEFVAGTQADAAAFYMQPADLGAYLLFDSSEQYLVAEGTALQRVATLQSDIKLVDDSYESEAEWGLEVSERDDTRLQLRHLKSNQLVSTQGLVADAQSAATIDLFEQTGCATFPELTLDATGTITQTEFDDGSVFGYVDTHSHIMSNFAFGGGGIYHGAPFHRLGVEHALTDCERFHGVDGKADLFGFGFDSRGAIDFGLLANAFLTGELSEFNHHTAGYPEFTTWPSAHFSSTHQVQYYKWLERAYLSGLRLVVQHATTNQIICDFLAGADVQPVRYSCNDMVAVDRILDETYNMERYIDAHAGGPGEGWFRIVTTPAQAREVISGGRMAVVLGIETSNLFDCFLVPSEEFPSCTEMDVLNKLDEYYDRGVRALFPVHKYDNGFSAGDGDKNFIELGNFIQTGHWGNFTMDGCPDINSSFDKGPPQFTGLNMPREVYDSPPPNDLSAFADDPLTTVLTYFSLIDTPPLVGDHCQSHGLTSLGEFLIEEMMQRGMILEVDHLPRRSYARAFEMLMENDYPAVGTHGLNNDGVIYALGGVSKSNFGTCRSETETSTVDNGFQRRIQTIRDNGGFPAEGFGLDLNGFAGARGPRFGENSGCEGQTDPVTYPFDSYAGDITFTEPVVGDRTLDFNTEGLAHIGLLAELLEDVRNDGVTDEDLEPFFKSAEGYIRMWEKAEQRGEALRAQ